jgi:hypothetical protein
MTAAAEDPLLKHLVEEAPPVLYHYTSMGVLESITRTRQIWLSEVSHLNDKTEHDHAATFMQGLLYERYPDLKLLVAENFSAWRFRQSFRETFVCSFTENADSLPQWRGYCSNGLGVAIGFSSAAIRDMEVTVQPVHRPDLESSFSAALMRCVYTREDKENLSEEYIDQFLRCMTSEANQNAAQQILTNVMSLCSPLFKHESFKEEQEWRLVVTSRTPDAPTRYFRIGYSSIIPYLTATLGADETVDFIKEIVIGPSPNEGLAVKGVERLLHARGFSGAIVKPSNIPYRMW